MEFSRYCLIMTQVQRLREELAGNRTKLASWEDKMSQARGACEAWQREVEEANRKANIAEQQRDEVIFIISVFK